MPDSDSLIHELRHRAKQAQTSKSEEQAKPIIEQCRTAADRGEYSLTLVDRWLAPALREYLESLGLKVKKGDCGHGGLDACQCTQDKWTTISWEQSATHRGHRGLHLPF